LLSPEIRWRTCEICRAKERAVRKEKRVAEQAAAKELERLREIVRAMEAKGLVTGLEGQQGKTQAGGGGVEVDVGTSQVEDEDEDAEDEDEGATEEEPADMNGNEDVDMANEDGAPDIGLNEVAVSETGSVSPGVSSSSPTTTTRTESTASPVTISYGSKGGTYHSIFRTNATPFAFSSVTNVDKNVEANAAKAVGDSTGTTKPTILTANLADSHGLTFKEYQPKARMLGQNPDLSVQVFKDLLAPKEKVCPRQSVVRLLTSWVCITFSKQTRGLWVPRPTMYIRALHPHAQRSTRLFLH
jgi:hypothetical protein